MVGKKSAVTSDKDSVLNFPHKIARLLLSGHSCGMFDPPAPSEAPSN